MRQVVGWDPEEGGLLIDQTFLHHLHCDAHRRGSGALPGPGLEHVQLAILDGELDVLHVRVVLLEDLLDLQKLLVDVRLPPGHLATALRGADATHHILALGVDQEFPVEPVLAGGRVSGKGHARSRILPHVAEDHRLGVHGGTDQSRDLVDLPVLDGPGSIPAAEYRLGGPLELCVGILREGSLDVLTVGLLVLRAELHHPFYRHLSVHLRLVLPLDLGEDSLEVLVIHPHHHIAEHVDETTVGVVGETGITRVLGQRLGGLVVQS